VYQLFCQTKCPSALTSFEKIMLHAKGRNIALFLDYDGTLSHIVDDPDNAVMTRKVSYFLKILSHVV
jgi:trehalose 6-phosphate phosphatase